MWYTIDQETINFGKVGHPPGERQDQNPEESGPNFKFTLLGKLFSHMESVCVISSFRGKLKKRDLNIFGKLIFKVTY